MGQRESRKSRQSYGRKLGTPPIQPRRHLLRHTPPFETAQLLYRAEASIGMMYVARFPRAAEPRAATLVPSSKLDERRSVQQRFVGEFRP